MSWISARMPEQAAQGIFTQVSVAARGERAAGDTRTLDQLHTDILMDLLGGQERECGDDCNSSNSTGGNKGKSGRGGSKGAGAGRGGRKGRSAGKNSGEGSGPGSGKGRSWGEGKGRDSGGDPETEEILRVGQRRKVPEGLKRFLRVRDGTCR